MWIPFERAEQLGRFLEAAAELHRPLLEQLPAGERPFFFHHWATQLNLSDCYLLAHRDRPMALATYPRADDRHFERWQVNSLAAHPDLEALPDLPRGLGDGVTFTVPAAGSTGEASIALPRATVVVQQITYARAADNPADTSAEPEWSFGIPAPEQLDAIVGLFSCRDRPAPGSDAYLDYYLPILTWNARRLHSLGTGFCYCATRHGSQEPVAAAWYSGWELPLAGVACALVDDILVLPDHRGRGLAAKLQGFAYAQLRAAGIRWVAGNIDPENPASMRQAEKVGRRPWTLNVKILPK